MTMSRQALTEDTPVRGAIKRAVEIGIGLFIAGFVAAGYIQTLKAELIAACDQKAREIRAETKDAIADAVQRERDRNALLYKRK